MSLLLVDMQQGQVVIEILSVPQISTYEAGTFYYSAIKDWNGLPVNIKEITNKDTFKDALKQFLNQQSRECEEDSFVYFQSVKVNFLANQNTGCFRDPFYSISYLISVV